MSNSQPTRGSLSRRWGGRALGTSRTVAPSVAALALFSLPRAFAGGVTARGVITRNAPRRNHRAAGRAGFMASEGTARLGPG